MLYSKTAKYAVLALAEVAVRSGDGFVPTQEIARVAAIPYGAGSDLDMAARIRQLAPSATLCGDVELELPG
jgi:hypothetical protein